jgi:molecular chaperone DnaK (HSP70)
MASSRVSDDNEAVIVVGIDFGTTFSGVAWTWSGKAENIEIVTSWEADFHGNSDNDKVPTAIKLGDNLGGAITWGYATSEGTDGKEPLKWFKLLLLDDDDLPADVRESTHLKEARKYLETVNRSAVEIITLFLRHLWNHALGVIRTEIGESLVKLSRFHVVITLPAIWPAYACARMREAARDAGSVKQSPGGKSTLSFVSEPEAAAIATLEEMKGRHDVKVSIIYIKSF